MGYAACRVVIGVALGLVAGCGGGIEPEPATNTSVVGGNTTTGAAEPSPQSGGTGGGPTTDAGSSDDASVLVGCDALTFSPAPGTFASAVSVTVTSPNPNAIIFITKDGTNPTLESAVFAAPIVVSSSTTIRAFARAAGSPESCIISGRFVVAP